MDNYMLRRNDSNCDGLIDYDDDDDDDNDDFDINLWLGAPSLAFGILYNRSYVSVD